MSKLFKIFAGAVLVAGAFALTPAPATAQHHWHGGWHHGWHGGGWGWGFGPGFALGFGAAYPYYGGPYYYAPPPEACGWTRVRVWRGDHWSFRRAWRCW